MFLISLYLRTELYFSTLAVIPVLVLAHRLTCPDSNQVFEQCLLSLRSIHISANVNRYICACLKKKKKSAVYSRLSLYLWYHLPQGDESSPGEFILEKSFEVCVHSSLLTFTDTVWHWHSLNMSDKSHVSVSVKQVSAIWIGSGLRMPQILLHLCHGKTRHYRCSAFGILSPPLSSVPVGVKTEERRCEKLVSLLKGYLQA